MLPHSYPFSFRLICLITSAAVENRWVSLKGEAIVSTKSKEFYSFTAVFITIVKEILVCLTVLGKIKEFLSSPCHLLRFGIKCFSWKTQKRILDLRCDCWAKTLTRFVQQKRIRDCIGIVQSFWSLRIRSAENLHVVSTPIAQSRVCVSTDKERLSPEILTYCTIWLALTNAVNQVLLWQKSVT